ncbi:MAG TPA: metallophosphoesterase [Gemmataceae bacterium]|nr:metallophosphoesterase [Gemmataceae bacterium]
MAIETLVRPLFDGPLDIIGDVHGEIAALTTLLQRLGYSVEGGHPRGRRLAFVGDLVDRGPDSPAVVALVQELIEKERAQCVLGNHELNILLGSRKPDNVWFFHHELPAGHAMENRPEVRADEQTQQEMLRFFASLPLALERPDLRIVHACWDDAMIAAARQATCAGELHREYQSRIDDAIQRRGLHDPLAIRLVRQNEDPVKRLTSGLEEKAPKPFVSLDGKWHDERRAAWWRDYVGPLCVFGHYWRILLPDEVDNDRLFPGVPRNATLGRGDAMCVDYSVGKRFKERGAPGFNGVFHTRLAALRLPERVLIFDDGGQRPLI